MEAAAALGVALAPGTARRTRISRLHSEAPYLLRPTHADAAEPVPGWSLAGQAPARVALVAGAGGPVGGDRLALHIDVGPGAVLVLRAVAATLVLPGPHGQRSVAEVTARVAAGGTLVWLPGPTIAARGCDHHATTHIELAPDARLLVREELVLGRTGEQPGTLRQRLRVTAAGAPLHDQELHLGDGARGWTGPAVTAGRRAVGSLLIVDPTMDVPAAEHLVDADADSAVLPLGGSGRLVTALAADALALRRRLDLALLTLAPPPPRGASVPDTDAGVRLSPQVVAMTTSG